MSTTPKLISVPTFKRLSHGDYTVLPFQAFKRYTITNQNFTGSLYGLAAYSAVYPSADTYPNRKLIPSASRYQRINSFQSIDPKILWHSLNHQYYKSAVTDGNYNGQLDTVNVVRHLYGTASVLSVPHKVFGEGIKPGSVTFDDYSMYDGTDASIIRIRDDGYGNLYDTTLDSSSYVDIDYLIGYWGFNEHFQDIGSSRISTKNVRDLSVKSNHGISSGVSYATSISQSGVRAVFDGQSYITIPHNDSYDFTDDDDFSISFWLNFPTSQSNLRIDESGRTVTSILSKQTLQTVDLYATTDKTTSYIEYESGASSWPFRVDLYSSASKGHVVMSKKGGNRVFSLVNTTALNPNRDYHIVCQQSASVFKVYVNGTLDGTQNASAPGIVTNKNHVLIGAYSTTSGRYSGSIDEMRIYGKALTSSEIVSLGDLNSASMGMYQSTHVGNVFYSTGVLVVSDPRTRYRNVFMGQTGQYDYGTTRGFSGTMRGVVTIHEHEILCKINQSEFNFTMNPSIRLNRDDTSDRLMSFVTSSYFTPYVTTIGLYNDRYELLAVAKLASPVPKRSDVDLNFIIRFDS